MFNLRIAESKDKKAILEIINFLRLDIPGFVWAQDEFVQKQIQDGEYFLVEREGEIAGIISFRQRGNKMYIETLAVVEKYRLQGIGTKLIEFAKEFTRKKGLAVLCACSFCEYEAKDFYLKQNFSLLDKCGEYNNHRYYFFEIRI